MKPHIFLITIIILISLLYCYKNGIYLGKNKTVSKNNNNDNINTDIDKNDNENDSTDINNNNYIKYNEINDWLLFKGNNKNSGYKNLKAPLNLKS